MYYFHVDEITLYKHKANKLQWPLQRAHHLDDTGSYEIKTEVSSIAKALKQFRRSQAIPF